jgi:chromate reductase
MSDAIKVLAISGSLRKASFNRMALAAAAELAPEGMVVDPYEIRDLPFYDGDVEAAGMPAVVEAFREKIRAADALLLVTPEYNSSISAVLKNAIDWGSRPPRQPFDGKPIAMMSASPGALGGIRAQIHLRQILGGINGMVLVAPTVLIGNAGQRFNAEGKLTDEPTRDFVRTLMVALKTWTLKLKA